MLVYSFEVNGDSDASTPRTEDTGSFTVTRVYYKDEASTVTGRYNHEPRTPTFPEPTMLYPRKFHLPKVGKSRLEPSSPSPVELPP